MSQIQHISRGRRWKEKNVTHVKEKSNDYEATAEPRPDKARKQTQETKQASPRGRGGRQCAARAPFDCA